MTYGILVCGLVWKYIHSPIGVEAITSPGKLVRMRKYEITIKQYRISNTITTCNIEKFLIGPVFIYTEKAQSQSKRN
jgi:hypothetical protein